jgi:hypothetical protein
VVSSNPREKCRFPVGIWSGLDFLNGNCPSVVLDTFRTRAIGFHPFGVILLDAGDDQTVPKMVVIGRGMRSQFTALIAFLQTTRLHFTLRVKPISQVITMLATSGLPKFISASTDLQLMKLLISPLKADFRFHLFSRGFFHMSPTLQNCRF